MRADPVRQTLPREDLGFELLVAGSLGFELQRFGSCSLLEVERLKELLSKRRKEATIGFVGGSNEVVQQRFAVHSTAIKILIFFFPLCARKYPTIRPVASTVSSRGSISETFKQIRM